MKDKMNRFFAFLASQHCFVYGLLGILFAFLFIHYVDPVSQTPILKRLIYPALLIIIANFFSLHSFYEKNEIGASRIPMTTSIVIKDNYFLEKITSSISGFKKIAGYLYVVLRAASIGIQGFVVGLGLFMWLIKGA